MKRFLKVGLLRLRAPNYVQSLAPASVWKNYNQVNIDSFTKQMYRYDDSITPERYKTKLKQSAQSHQTEITNTLFALEGMVNPTISTAVTDHVLYSSYYEDAFEKWNITKIAEQLNISGEDVFVSLLSNTQPSNNLGSINYENLTEDNALRQEFRDRCKQSPSSKHVHFDWYNGIGVKNNFPKQGSGYPFSFNMKRFNIGYPRIIGLITAKVIEVNGSLIQD